jgi:hypothetical protein
MAGQIIYANTCVEQESGDVGGYVVNVSDNEQTPTISLKWSEGSLKGPVRAKVTDYVQESGRLAFSVQTEVGVFGFKGTLRAHKIEGVVSSPWESPRRVELTERSDKDANQPEIECPPEP